MSDVQEKEHNGPLTRVTKLKIGGDWDWNVSYIQTFQELTVHTNDSPRDSMSAAIADVVLKALAYIKIKDVLVLMDSITFSDGDKGPTFNLVLDAKSAENQYCRMKWSIAKINRDQKLDPRTGEDAKGFMDRNRLNDAVDVLEEEIRKYALGDRLQKELKVQDTPETKVMRQQDFFGAVEKARSALVEDFKKQGAKVTINTPGIIDVDFQTQSVAQK
jgi:hypothetical protein